MFFNIYITINITDNLIQIKPKIFMLPFAFLRLYKH